MKIENLNINLYGGINTMSIFEDKVVLITGGAGGIGKVTAEDFLKEGAKVALVDLSDDALDEAKSNLEEYGEVFTITADVSKEEDVENYVKETVDHFDKIDVFFNNAGIEGEVAPIHEQSVDNFDQVLGVNARGIFLGLKHVIPVILEAGKGSIINTSSVSGLQGDPGVAPYVASKHAVVGLTKTAAIEVAEQGIRVNSIHPSPANTRMMRSLEEGMGTTQEDLAKTIPIGRYAESSDVSNIVRFLASDDSDFITGVQYRVDGGMGI